MSNDAALRGDELRATAVQHRVEAMQAKVLTADEASPLRLRRT
jgi:hypothetical protein